MKKVLCVLMAISLLFVSCGNHVLDTSEFENDYTLLNTSGMDMYTEIIESLTSGEILFEYSENPSVAPKVQFKTLDNGEKMIIATINRPDYKNINYYDGENLYLIVNGEGRMIEGATMEKDVLYRNYLGAPEDAINSDAIVENSAYLKKDNSEYVIVIETDYQDEGKMKLAFYLDSAKTPKYMKIYSTYYDEKGKEEIDIITMTYSKLGEEITISAPEFTIVE